jgi:nitroreductase
MELKEAIYGRRSVRKYSERMVEYDVLQEIMDAAMWAPSGVNLQPWYYVVIRTPENMARFRQFMTNVSEGNRAHLEERFAAHPEVAESSIAFIRNMGNAPVAVLAFRDKPDYSWALQDEGIVQSIAASMENLLLSAYDHGVSSCWLTAPAQAHMTGEIRDEFAPGHGELVAIAVLGYAEEGAVPKAPKRKADKYLFI